MEATKKRVLQVMALIGFSASLNATINTVAPYLQVRPTSRDLAGKISGTTSYHSHLYGMESYYGFFDVRFRYGQSWRPNDIRKGLFGNALVTNTGTTTTSNDGDIIVVSGSTVANRNASTDLLAENSYLPGDFKSTLAFKPRSRKFQVDFQFYMALDEWVEGLFFRMYAPVVHTKNDLRFSETNVATGAAAYPAGFFAPADVPFGSLLTSSGSYANGTTINVTGIKANGLNFAKIKGDDDRKTEFGELRFELGYDFLLDEDYHFGIYLEGAAPTGKRPTGEFLWEANGTNGKHGELGGGVTGHYTSWRSEDEEKHFDFVVEADFTHLFKAKQIRTFDLKNNGGLSRYMLAEKLGTPVTGLTAGTTPTAPNRQFQNEYTPVANISTVEVNSSFGVQADVVGMFNFTARGWNFGIGYEFFGGSSEKLTLRDDEDAIQFAANTWALKGLSNTIGFTDANAAIPLSATDSNATITSSSTTIIPGTGSLFNLNIDNAQVATGLNARADGGATTINTSLQPVMLSADDLNLEGAETKAQSRKLFTDITYTWTDREDWIPFIGLGAEVEFGKMSKHDDTNTTTTSTTSTTSSSNTALTQWGVSIKGGLSFN